MMKVLVVFFLFACIISEIAGARCDIDVHADFDEKIVPEAGPCADKAVTVSFSNVYRAYCTNGEHHCANYHFAYHPGTRTEKYRHCVPIPGKGGNYTVVKHENVAVTCDDGATQATLNFHYVNATKCSCTTLIQEYKIFV